MVRPTDLPANPLSIELTVARRGLRWTVHEDTSPESWHVSADVSQLTPCPEVLRHAGDLSMIIADVRRDGRSLGTGEPAVDHALKAVADHDGDRLHPELDVQIRPGPARVVIVRNVSLARQWRGQGLAEVLIARTLQALVRQARLAVCRISPADLADVCPDPVAAELASVRLAGMLERLGFFPWRGVHVVDMREPALAETRRRFIERWRPYVDDAHAASM